MGPLLTHLVSQKETEEEAALRREMERLQVRGSLFRMDWRSVLRPYGEEKADQRHRSAGGGGETTERRGVQDTIQTKAAERGAVRVAVAS